MFNKKNISWLLVILWMVLIFIMSNMTGEVSTKASVGGIEKTITVVADTTNKMNIIKKDNDPNGINLDIVKDIKEVKLSSKKVFTCY